MTDTTRKLSAFFGLPVVAGISTFVMLMLAASVVSSLSRPIQGESVRVSWAACMLGSLGLSFLLPWLASLPLLRQPSLRVYFLFCLAATVAIWYFLFGFDDLLSKAYRRGL
jgi:hypothetical protein